MNALTLGQEYVDIPTLPDYIPIGAPPILGMTYSFSHGLRGDMHLYRYSTKASERAFTGLRVQYLRTNFFHSFENESGDLLSNFGKAASQSTWQALGMAW